MGQDRRDNALTRVASLPGTTNLSTARSSPLPVDTSRLHSYLLPTTFNLSSTMPIKIGTSAPDFTLKTKTAQGLEDVKLSDNFGKKNTVLLFFPLAFTGVCTAEMCDVSGGISAYESLNATVYAISVDSPFAQAAWAEKEKIGLKLLSDLNKTVIKAYDVVFPNLAGVGDTAARAAIVIDKAGMVAYAEQTATPKDLPDFEAVKAALAKLK